MDIARPSNARQKQFRRAGRGWHDDLEHELALLHAEFGVEAVASVKTLGVCVMTIPRAAATARSMLSTPTA